MEKKLSPTLTEQLKKMLPALRKETEEELTKWGDYVPGGAFYNDEKVIETVPFAAYEFLWMSKKIKLAKKDVIQWLNEGIFKDVLDKVICHALRRLALRK
jgi:hypothetical protein